MTTAGVLAFGKYVVVKLCAHRSWKSFRKLLVVLRLLQTTLDLRSANGSFDMCKVCQAKVVALCFFSFAYHAVFWTLRWKMAWTKKTKNKSALWDLFWVSKFPPSNSRLERPPVSSAGAWDWYSTFKARVLIQTLIQFNLLILEHHMRSVRSSWVVRNPSHPI